MNHILVGDFNIPKVGDRAFNALESKGFTIVKNKKGSNKQQTKWYDQISFMSEKSQVRMCPSEKASGTLQFFNSIFREEDFESYRDRLIKAQDEKIVNYISEITEIEGKIERARSENSKARHREKIEELREKIKEAQAIIADDDLLSLYYLSEWRTFHASDHLPLWVELKIDFSAEYLDKLR